METALRHIAVAVGAAPFGRAAFRSTVATWAALAVRSGAAFRAGAATKAFAASSFRTAVPFRTTRRTPFGSGVAGRGPFGAVRIPSRRGGPFVAAIPLRSLRQTMTRVAVARFRTAERAAEAARRTAFRSPLCVALRPRRAVAVALHLVASRFRLAVAVLLRFVPRGGRLAVGVASRAFMLAAVRTGLPPRIAGRAAFAAPVHLVRTTAPRPAAETVAESISKAAAVVGEPVIGSEAPSRIRETTARRAPLRLPLRMVLVRPPTIRFTTAGRRTAVFGVLAAMGEAARSAEAAAVQCEAMPMAETVVLRAVLRVMLARTAAVPEGVGMRGVLRMIAVASVAVVPAEAAAVLSEAMPMAETVVLRAVMLARTAAVPEGVGMRAVLGVAAAVRETVVPAEVAAVLSEAMPMAETVMLRTVLCVMLARTAAVPEGMMLRTALGVAAAVRETVMPAEAAAVLCEAVPVAETVMLRAVLRMVFRWAEAVAGEVAGMRGEAVPMAEAAAVPGESSVLRAMVRSALGVVGCSVAMGTMFRDLRDGAAVVVAGSGERRMMVAEPSAVVCEAVAAEAAIPEAAFTDAVAPGAMLRVVAARVVLAAGMVGMRPVGRAPVAVVEMRRKAFGTVVAAGSTMFVRVRTKMFGVRSVGRSAVATVVGTAVMVGAAVVAGSGPVGTTLLRGGGRECDSRSRNPGGEQECKRMERTHVDLLKQFQTGCYSPYVVATAAQ